MAKGLVGLEGRGEATVFGGTTNPIAVYMQTQAARQRRQLQEAEQRQKQVDELLDYNEKFRPETKFADLNYTLANAAKEVSDVTRQRLRESGNPSLAMAEAQNMQREVLALGKEMDGWKADIETLDKTVSDLQTKGVLKPEAKQAVRYGWRNPDGSIKSIPEIRQWANRMGETLNDPTIYDPKGTAKNWISGLQDQATHVYSKMKGAIGYNDDDVETTIKSKLKYKTDGTGLVLDENQNPIPEINDFTLSLALQDPYMRTVITANGGPDKESQKQYLQSLIEPGADIIDYGDRQITRGRKLDDGSGSGSTKVNTDIEIVPKGAVTYKSEITPNDFSGKTPIGVSGPSLDIQNVLPIQNRNIEVTDNQGNKQKAQILGFQVDEGGKQKILVNGFDNLGKVVDKPFTIPMSEENVQRLLNTPMTNQKRTELVKAINDFKKMPVDQNFADPAKLDSGINQIAKAFNPEGKFQSANNFDSNVASDNLRNLIVSDWGISKIRAVGDDGVERIEDVVVEADSGNTRWNTNTIKVNGQSFDLNEEGIKKLKIFLLKNAPDKFIKGGSTANFDPTSY